VTGHNSFHLTKAILRREREEFQFEPNLNIKFVLSQKEIRVKSLLGKTKSPTCCKFQKPKIK
jgi:hypothetical protein